MVLTPESIAPETLLNCFEGDATILTGNDRLAGALRSAYETRAIAAGRTVWATPDILPWATWLRRLNEERLVRTGQDDAAIVLTPQQEQILWEQVIEDSHDGSVLLQTAGTARRAREAWELVHAWSLPLHDSSFNFNDDSRAFIGWAKHFTTRCRKHHWISQAVVAERVADWLPASDGACAANIVITGFDELTPQQQRLVQALIAAGTAVRWLETRVGEVQARRVECADARAEAQLAARWLRARMEADAQAQIGLVVPDLRRDRGVITQALDELLAAGTSQPGQAEQPRPYNLSLGQPLCDWPIVFTALSLLRLLDGSLPMEVVQRLLASPHLAGWDTEASARALLDARLREQGEVAVSLATLKYHAQQEDRSYHCPLLVKRLLAWRDMLSGLRRDAGAASWAEMFSKLLQIAGWAQGRPLSSHEYQAVEAWKEVLGVLASLEPVAGRMSATTALSRLRRLAAERVFQPKTASMPVQVLGIMEAIGQRFDHLWVMGLHDGNWPSPPLPNPFLPLPLQRREGLPRADEQRELAFAQRVTERLLASAGEAVVSSPQRDGDETLRPSPLIMTPQCSLCSKDDLQLWQGEAWAERIAAAAQLEQRMEDVAPAVVNETVYGGSAVFKLQAACPFRAFAELRLGARPLQEVEVGLNPMVRGSLVHEVLESVWGTLRTHAQLLSRSRDELETLVRTAVGEEIQVAARRLPDTFTARFQVLESERLVQQVLEWLALEKQRPSFSVIEREAIHEGAVAGVPVRLKFDRVDELDQGGRIVIDYKTGKVEAAQWFGERPDEPQLPLYVSMLDGEVAGVAFGQLQVGSMGFKGVTEQDGMLPKVKGYQKLQQTKELSSWVEVVANWQRVLDDLGAGFLRGDAAVDPKRLPKTCAYCRLQPLCRIHETTPLDLVDENGDEQA